MIDLELQQNRLFQAMEPQEIQAALEALEGCSKSYRKGQAVLRAGSPTDRLCLVQSGTVTIENNDLWGNRTVLTVIGAGDLFAETYAVLSSEPLLVDAVANEDCRILSLRLGKLFQGPLTQDWAQKLTRNLLVISAQKNLLLSGRAFHTSPKTARGRIMAYLNSVSLKRRSSIFEIPFDRQQMADYLNLERTALSKELGRMRRQGVIDFRKNRFQLMG